MKEKCASTTDFLLEHADAWHQFPVLRNAVPDPWQVSPRNIKYLMVLFVEISTLLNKITNCSLEHTTLMIVSTLITLWVSCIFYSKIFQLFLWYCPLLKILFLPNTGSDGGTVTTFRERLISRCSRDADKVYGVGCRGCGWTITASHGTWIHTQNYRLWVRASFSHDTEPRTIPWQPDYRSKFRHKPTASSHLLFFIVDLRTALLI